MWTGWRQRRTCIDDAQNWVKTRFVEELMMCTDQQRWRHETYNLRDGDGTWSELSSSYLRNASRCRKKRCKTDVKSGRRVTFSQCGCLEVWAPRKTISRSLFFFHDATPEKPGNRTCGELWLGSFSASCRRVSCRTAVTSWCLLATLRTLGASLWQTT